MEKSDTFEVLTHFECLSRASFHYNNDVIVVYSLNTQGGQITKGFADKYYTDPLDPPVNLVIEGFIFDTRSFHYWLALDIVLFFGKE